MDNPTISPQHRCIALADETHPQAQCHRRQAPTVLPRVRDGYGTGSGLLRPDAEWYRVLDTQFRPDAHGSVSYGTVQAGPTPSRQKSTPNVRPETGPVKRMNRGGVMHRSGTGVDNFSPTIGPTPSGDVGCKE
jgi:hypothetical protein